MLSEKKTIFLPKQEDFFEKRVFSVGRNLSVTLNEKVRQEKHLMGTKYAKKLAKKKKSFQHHSQKFKLIWYTTRKNEKFPYQSGYYNCMKRKQISLFV